MPDTDANNDKQLALRPDMAPAVRHGDEPRPEAEIARDKKIVSVADKVNIVSGMGIVALPLTIDLTSGLALHHPASLPLALGACFLSGLVNLGSIAAWWRPHARLNKDTRNAEKRIRRLWNEKLVAKATEILDKAIDNGRVYEGANYVFDDPNYGDRPHWGLKKYVLRVTELANYHQDNDTTDSLQRITARLYDEPFGAQEFSKSWDTELPPIVRIRKHPLALPLPTLSPDPVMENLLKDAVREQAGRPVTLQGPASLGSSDPA